MPLRHDAIIVGAGHNGLVTAAYLGRAGRRVLVLERRELVGGACVTEELWPGFKVSTAAYVTSLLRPEIIRDLALDRHGLELLPRSPSSFTPFPDGRYLLMGPDREMTRREVAKFSSRDADALPRYEAMLERVAAFIEPTLLMTPPNPWSLSPRQLLALARLGLRFVKLGKDGAHAVQILTGAARRLLDRWFESEQLKVTLATDAIIGARASPSMPGTAYVLFHHVMGECDGVRGVWGYVRGGMGGISNALAAAARERGAEIRVNAEVRKILVKDGRASGVALADGTEIQSPVIVSGCDPAVTFLQLIDPAALPAEFLETVGRIDYSSASLKINVALSELPDFRALPGAHPGPQHRGTIHIAPSPEGPPPDVHVHAVLPVPAAGGIGGGGEGGVRRPVLSDHGRVRPELPALGHRAAGAGPDGHRGSLRSHRRQHLSGGDDAGPALLPPPGPRLRGLPHARERTLPVRRGHSSRRRDHGRVRVQCGPRDPSRPVSYRFSTESRLL